MPDAPTPSGSHRQAHRAAPSWPARACSPRGRRRPWRSDEADEAGWRADVVVARAGSYDLDLAADHPRRPGRAGARAGLGPGQVGPAQAEPGRAVERRPRRSTPTRRWSGPSPRSSGRGAPARSSSPRGRGIAATPASSSNNRASARSSTRRGWSSSTSTTTTSSPVANRRGFTGLRIAPPARLAEAGRPGRLAAEDEDAPLGRRHPGDEEPVRRDAGRGLRLAQERPAPRGNPGSILDINAAVRPAPGDRRRDRRHGGGRADHGHASDLPACS